MSFCSFSKESNSNAFTSVDNKFIGRYLPEASGDAVKVYLYGLYLCSSGEETDLKKFAEELSMEQSAVAETFAFWDELGLVSVISSDPYTVKYLPISAYTRKKYDLEKYSDFNRALQALLPDRMITTNEYAAYFQLMEERAIKPEAMLMIVKYCVDRNDGSIGFRYILKVAGDFAEKGITTVGKIEKELSDFYSRSDNLDEIFAKICPNRKPAIEDIDLIKKWLNDMAFDKESVLLVAKQTKAKNLQKIDRELKLLFANKKFSVTEIKAYYKDRNKNIELAYKIDKTLSLYVEVVDPVVDNYVIPWLNKGYDEESLLFVANYCFKKNRRSLEEMNDTIGRLYEKGLITVTSIADFAKSVAADDEFIKKLLSSAGLNRKPTEWDRENLKTWRGWNFSDEMILRAAETANGKNNPLPYINAVLSGWKNDGVYSADKIPANKTAASKSGAFKSREYTQAELDSLIDDIDDVEF